MPKNPETIFVCQNCGRQSRKWLGQCPDCNQWNTFVEETFKPSLQNRSRTLKVPLLFNDISLSEEPRFSSQIEEFDRVLGGGVVPGSLILVGGPPGIGKSTLMLQFASNIAENGLNALYVSGEESVEQLKMRGLRLQISSGKLSVLSETNLDDIIYTADNLQPSVLIIDSIQTIYQESISSAPGSVSQVREAASALMLYAKRTQTAVFITGHVTKDGLIAGPKTLEHIVDTVVYFDGDRHYNHRIIRAVKNRFGAAGEIGVFEMTGRGLRAVANPSELFLAERPVGASGSVVTIAMEGTRPLLVEAQALVGNARFGSGRRTTQGYDHNRVALIIAVLERKLGYQLSGDDCFVNIAGGIEIDETAGDLAVAAAIASSYRNTALAPGIALFGEIGLTGEVRGVSAAEVRAREAQRLGFASLIVPETNRRTLKSLIGIKIIGVSDISEMIDAVFNSKSIPVS